LASEYKKYMNNIPVPLQHHFGVHSVCPWERFSITHIYFSRYLDVKGRKEWKRGENCVTRSIIIHTLYKLFLG
jgi:hypothetical protein